MVLLLIIGAALFTIPAIVFLFYALKDAIETTIDCIKNDKAHTLLPAIIGIWAMVLGFVLVIASLVIGLQS